MHSGREKKTKPTKRAQQVDYPAAEEHSNGKHEKVKRVANTSTTIMKTRMNFLALWTTEALPNVEAAAGYLQAPSALPQSVPISSSAGRSC